MTATDDKGVWSDAAAATVQPLEPLDGVVRLRDVDTRSDNEVSWLWRDGAGLPDEIPHQPWTRQLAAVTMLMVESGHTRPDFDLELVCHAETGTPHDLIGLVYVPLRILETDDVELERTYTEALWKAVELVEDRLGDDDQPQMIRAGRQNPYLRTGLIA